MSYYQQPFSPYGGGVEPQATFTPVGCAVTIFSLCTPVCGPAAAQGAAPQAATITNTRRPLCTYTYVCPSGGAAAAPQGAAPQATFTPVGCAVTIFSLCTPVCGLAAAQGAAPQGPVPFYDYHTFIGCHTGYFAMCTGAAAAAPQGAAPPCAAPPYSGYTILCSQHPALCGLAAAAAPQDAAPQGLLASNYCPTLYTCATFALITCALAPAAAPQGAAPQGPLLPTPYPWCTQAPAAAPQDAAPQCAVYSPYTINCGRSAFCGQTAAAAPQGAAPQGAAPQGAFQTFPPTMFTPVCAGGGAAAPQGAAPQGIIPPSPFCPPTLGFPFC